MKHFKEYEKLAYSFIKENDNYIIFNDGKPIRQALNEDSVEINVDYNLDSFDICKRKRPLAEENVIKNARFNNYVNIKKDIDLKIIYLNDEEKNLSFSFDIDKDVHVNLTQVFLSCKKNTNMVRDYNLNDNVILNNTVFNNYESIVTEYNNYYLDDKANLIQNDLNINENEAKAFNEIYLYSEKASASINNSAINVSSFSQKNNTKIYHSAKKTKSELVCYGVVNNKSSLNMDTQGYIKKGASKSDMHQKSKGILLDLESSIIASPDLYIDEYDCMAGHGASVGAIDDSDIFYLMSRGLKRNSAEKLVVYGFFNPYLSTIKDEEILKYIKKLIENKLENK